MNPVTTAGPLLPWLLAALAPMNRTRVKELLRHGRVRVNDVPVTRHDHPLQPGDCVSVGQAALAADPVDRLVVYEDDHLLVFDKPAGLLTVATEAEKADTAFARLAARQTMRGAARPFVVHRLDRETSGLLLFALTPAAREQLQAAWPAVTKTYLALVEGTPVPAAGTVDNFLTEGKSLRVRVTQPGGLAKRAVTHYRTLHAASRHSLVEVTLATGRKHQIRVHLAGLDCPVAGDPAYGAKTNPLGRLALHAWRLAFAHPADGRRLAFESRPPKALRPHE